MALPDRRVLVYGPLSGLCAKQAMVPLGEYEWLECGHLVAASHNDYPPGTVSACLKCGNGRERDFDPSVFETSYQPTGVNDA